MATIFSVFNKLFDLLPPALIGFAVDTVVSPDTSFLSRFVQGGARDQLMLLAFITALVWILESLFEYLFELAWKTLAQQTQDEIRTDAYAHLQRQGFAYFEDTRTGELVTILNEDVNQLERFLNVGANDIIQVVTTILVIGGMYIVIAPGVAWVAVLPIPFIVWASLWFQKFLEPRYRKVREAAGETSSQLSNNIQGMATIKSYGTEDHENRRIAELSAAYRIANESTIKLSAAFIPMIRMIILAGFIAIMVMAGMQAIEGSLAVGLYSMMIYIVQRLLWPLTRLGQTFDLYQRAMASIRRIMKLLHEDNQLTDGSHPMTREQARSSIEIRDLHFSYSRGPEVLAGISLNIEPGWTVGIVGATGAGKTSLVKLMLRLYDPVDGSIRIDGRDLRDYRIADLVQHLALVSQDVFLFHGSVKENIRYGSPEADDQQVREAARLAEAHDFIERLPQGYDTVVGERGQKLSGGQRQRVSIARALLKNAPILVLDEATSSVDNETEAAIQRSLSKIAHSRTTIVIAHRLSTIRHADRIFVLSDGRLEEAGTHEQLLGKQGIYHGLWKVQSGDATILTS